MTANRRWNNKKLFDGPITEATETEDVVTITSEDGDDTAAIIIYENDNWDFAWIQATSSAALPITYSIVGGADAAKFEINATSGVLGFVWSFNPNYEAPADADGNNHYEVVVQASDGVASDQQAWTIKIINENEAPFFTSYGGAASTSVSIVENSIAAATVAASDPEGMTSLSFAIVGGADAALFVVNPWNGLVTFRANPDYEAPRDSGANNVYDVTIRATDQFNTVTQAIAVTVTNAATESSSTGTTSDDLMTGTSGNDVIMGLEWFDTLSGLGGDDLLDGGSGSDYLIGGAGADQLISGTGQDRFQYDHASDSMVGSPDRIWDLNRGQGDKILLSGVDANSLLAGDQAFTFISTSAFSGVAGQLRYVRAGGETNIYGDLDGDAVADFHISINGEHNLFSNDFVL